MNCLLFLLSCVAIILCTSGCQTPQKSSDFRVEEGNWAKKIDAIAAKNADATQEMNYSTYTRKNEFVAKMQLQIDSIQSYLKQTAKLIEKSAENTTRNQSKLSHLLQQTTALEVQLQGARNTNAISWDELRDRLMKSYYALDKDIIRAAAVDE